MREALSIEFASGGLTALGSKAKECLERCKKVEPDLRSIPIPVREKIVKPAAPLAATPGQHSRAPSSGNARSAASHPACYILTCTNMTTKTRKHIFNT